MNSVEKQSMIQLSHHLSQEVWYYFDWIWSIIITTLITCSYFCFSIEFQWNNIFSNWLLLYFVRIEVELSGDCDPVFKIMLLKASAFGLYTIVFQRENTKNMCIKTWFTSNINRLIRLHSRHHLKTILDTFSFLWEKSMTPKV